MASKDDTYQICRRYAKALYDLSEKEGVLSSVKVDAGDMLRTIEGSADLQALLVNPSISDKEIEAVMAAAAEKSLASPMLQRFLAVSVRNGKAAILKGMLETFLDYTATQEGEETATVTSAYALKSTDVTLIRKGLEEAYDKKFNIETRVDEALLGGTKIQVGSTLIDDSLKSKLARMQTALMAEQGEKAA